MPVNASSSYWIPLQCVLCVLREYAQQTIFIRTVSKAWPRVLAVYIYVLEWWANKTVGNKTGSACPYQSICPVPIQWEGSNLHVKQNPFIAILRNLYRE